MRICLLMLLAPSAFASSIDWSGELQTGWQYDSQVAIAELDDNSKQGDHAWLLNAKIRGQVNTKNATWSAGYQLQQQRYQSLSNYQLSTQTLHGAAQFQHHQWLSTVQLHHADAKLAGAPFLQLQLAHASIGHPLGDTGFLQLVWQGQRKAIAQASQRDALNQSIGLDYFLLPSHGKNTWHASVRWDNETAELSSLSYAGWQATLSYQHKFERWQIPQQWQLAMQTWQRQYSHDATRQDRRWTVQSNWQLDLASAWQLQWALEHSRNQSSLAKLNYHEWVASTRISWQF